MTEEISELEAKTLLKEGYGLFTAKNFLGAKKGGKYVANKGQKWWKCSKLSEAAKVLGLKS